MNNSIFLATLAFALLALTGTIQVQAQNQTVITTTTLPGQVHHHWNHAHWLWKHGLANPQGVLTQSNNIVAVPAQQLSQTVVNNCPQDTPVLLSTGACITAAQALQMIQNGQISVGGQVQTQGQTVIGTPTVIQAQGFQNPFAFVGHYHQQLQPGMTITKQTTTTTTVQPQTQQNPTP